MRLNPISTPEGRRMIRDGKRYDTLTATPVADLQSRGVGPGDFGYWEATLYRTPRGRWFIDGWGNAASLFARSNGDGMSSEGAGMKVVSDEWAQHQLEQIGAIDDLEQYFSVEDA
jgi:hypothetical protein